MTPAVHRVEDIIHAIVDDMGIRYIYDRWNTVNLQLDNGEFPVVVNVLPVSGSFDIGRRYRDQPNCMIAFLEKAELDFDGEINEDAVEKCKALATNFISRVNLSGKFRPIEGEVKYSVVYDKLDVATTGVIIELKLREIAGICPPSPDSIKDILDNGESTDL